MNGNRYTAAMLAELVGVHVSRVRSWQRRGWIVPAEQTHRLAYFDFAELTVARQLAELSRLGLTPKTIERKLTEIGRRFPDVKRPLAELTLVVDGRTLLVRRGSELVEPGGQLRIDFEASSRADDEESRAVIPSPAVFLSHPGWQRSSPLASEHGQDARATRHGEDARATRHGEDARATLEEAAPQRLVAWAVELDEAGELLAAAEMYRAALAAGGPQPEVCFQLAEALYRAGDLTGARERYFMAIELDEDYVEARVNLGCVLVELGERELAVGAFSGALRSHEAYADAHYHLARTLDELERGGEAVAHWRRFAELSPESPWVEEARERLGGQRF